MERRQIGLQLVMDQLGLPVAVETFDDRLKLQKAIYLAQAAGVDLGYYYRWYLRGPYCPAVAEDGFAVSTSLKQGLREAQGWKLDSTSTRRLAQVRGVMERLEIASLARRVELLASVHFLIGRRQVPDPKPETVSQTLRRFNKVFGQKEVARAIQEMKDNGLLS